MACNIPVVAINVGDVVEVIGCTKCSVVARQVIAVYEHVLGKKGQYRVNTKRLGGVYEQGA